MRIFVAITGALLVACGDDGGGSAVDAAPDAYDTARCLIRGNYGALGAMTGTTSQGPTTLTVVLDAGPPRDSFFIKLNAGKGAFTGGLANGTFPITGADASSPTCGLCVNIIADIVAMQGPSKFYFATAGSVTLTNTQPPTGSVSDLSFVEVGVNGDVMPGGCTATIDSMSFSM
ncbi:MAG: hypothetical protein AB7T06_23830 [Kofleriaceae bacterium]